MALNEKKITAEEIAENGVVSVGDILSGNAQENKAVFDRLVREIVSVKFNEVIDELISAAGAGQIGVETLADVPGENVQEVLNTLKEYIDNKAVNAGAMTSFNGRNGDVIPLAGDYTAAMVGAAPEGFGLGTTAPIIETIEQLNSFTQNGWCRVVDTDLSLGTYSCSNWFINVTSFGDDYVVQRCYPVANTRPVLIRWLHGGEWVEEWETPPLAIGKEYRTTERYASSVVWQKLVNCGEFNLEASKGKSIAHGIEGCRPIECTGRLVTAAYSVPYVTSSGARISISANSSNINVYTTFAVTNPGNLIAKVKLSPGDLPNPGLLDCRWIHYCLNSFLFPLATVITVRVYL